MTLLIAGDIGGTKTILRLVQAQSPTQIKNLYQATYPSAKYPDLVPIVEAFLIEAAAQLGALVGALAPIESACFGIAGPVVNNTSNVTNLGWKLQGDRIAQELHIPKVSLINDFASVGYGVLGLQDEDLVTLNVGESDAEAPIAVIGAGTGLGQGFLIHGQTGYQVFSSEGGHADFAPRTELEFQLSRYLMAKFGVDRLSVERVVSGQGIVSIYQFLRDRGTAKESLEISQAIHQWESEIGLSAKTIDPGAVIGAGALEAGDPLCLQTLEMFVDAYGAEAGNLALKLLPYGGLYIAGGIGAKLLPLMEEGQFMRSFLHKGRMRSLLEAVPVHLILNPQVGLIGSSVCGLSVCNK
jgi:glucokinase